MSKENQIANVIVESETPFTTAVATVDETGKMLASLEGSVNMMYCSIVDDGTQATKAKIYNAMNDTKGNIKKAKNPVKVTDIIAHPVTLLNEQTGEMNDKLRIVFVDENGETWHSVADGVMGSVQRIVGMFGPAPWHPGIPLLAREQETRKGFTTIVLDIVTDAMV